MWARVISRLPYVVLLLLSLVVLREIVNLFLIFGHPLQTMGDPWLWTFVGYLLFCALTAWLTGRNPNLAALLFFVIAALTTLQSVPILFGQGGFDPAALLTLGIAIGAWVSGFVLFFRGRRTSGK